MKEKNNLTDERIKSLEKIGIDWNNSFKNILSGEKINSLKLIGITWNSRN